MFRDVPVFRVPVFLEVLHASLQPAGPEIKITPAKGAYALSHKNWHKIYIKSKGSFSTISKNKKVNLILS